MRQKRVEFLRHFNDFRMLSMFTMDVVGIAFITFILFYSVLAFGGVPTIILVISSFFTTWLATYMYIQAKKNSSRGYLRHWMFNKGFYRLHKDEEKWEELKYADKKNYFPNGNDKFFAD